MNRFTVGTPHRWSGCPAGRSVWSFATSWRAVVLTALLSTLELHGADWPQFFGPNRDGRSAETLNSVVPKEGAPVLWKSRVGAGFSGPVITGGKAILFHRVGDEDILEAYDAQSGKSLWRSREASTYVDDFGFDNGPKATPAVKEGRVFVLGADGQMSCVSLEDGRRIWSKALRKDLNAGKGFFGIACSPVVEGNLVLVNIGGQSGAGIVALDAATGDLRWKATDHEASYSSPVVTTIQGKRRALFFTRDGLTGLDPADGRVSFEFPWRASIHASVNAAIPILAGDAVFLTASYDTGGVFLKLKADGVDKVWAGDESLSSQFSSPILKADHLYGFHGRVDGAKPDLRCVEVKTGKVLWEERRLGPGSVLGVGDDLLVVLESGEILVAPAVPKAFQPRARFQGLGNGARATPAFSGGKLYARDKQQLYCIDFGGK